MNNNIKSRPWRLAAIILGIIFVGVLLFEMMQVKVKPTSVVKPAIIDESTTTLIKTKPQPEKEFTIWSTSYHISPIECLRHFLENDFRKKTGRKVKIINKSLSGHCHIPKTCAKDLKVLNSGNGGFTPCHDKIGEKLFDSYKQDDEFAQVDLVMCDHNIAMCELYMAFDKPMVLQATTRYELWRHSPNEWMNLNQNLEKIAAKKHNSIVANNLFDANYVQYFTGLKIPVFDSYCAYSADEGTYNPTRSEFLIGPSRSSAGGAFFETINKLISDDGNKIQIRGIRQLYSHFKYSDLASHPAIIIIPYQVSVMSFFEYYRMNIPMYAPSIELLTKWHVDHRILSERTWGLVGSGGNVGAKGSPSEMKKHQNANLPNFDPNNDVDYTSVLFWNQYSDFYQWPHIITFNSWEDLFGKLKGTSLDTYKEISKKMAMYNAEVSDSLVRKWTDVIERAESKKDRNQKSTLTFEQAMKKHWNIDLKC